MGGTVRVACIQSKSELGHKDKNLEHLADLIEEAASMGAKVIVAPEMALCGYAYASPQAVMDEAEPVPGPATKSISELAKRLGVYVSFGLAEKAATPGMYFNSSALIGPDGEILGTYRKSHLAVEDTT